LITPIIGLVLGIVIGYFLPFDLPAGDTLYVAIGILACMDSVLGGLRATLTDKFQLDIFLSGFFGNAVIAVVLVYVGNILGISLYIAAIVMYGIRLFQNFAAIRRHGLIFWQRQKK